MRTRRNYSSRSDTNLKEFSEEGVVVMKSRKTVVEMPKQLTAPMTEAERREAIAKAAYFLSERRGFQPGHELEDWIAAEARVHAETTAD